MEVPLIKAKEVYKEQKIFFPEKEMK